MVIASIFTTVIVRPLFNVLSFIYAILPGHNFGLAIILFTLLVRIVMWPLVKKQLHQAKIMRELQPELKRIKKESKGNRQKESQLLMELYKERGVNPVGSIIILIPQFIVLIGLYDGLVKVAANSKAIVTFSYTWIQHLAWMQHLTHNIHAFDDTLLGVVNLTKSATSAHGIYWPAMVIVLASAVAQYYQSKQLMPTSKDSKSLRQILKEAGSGGQADQSEVNASVAKSTRWLLPVMIFVVTVNRPAAISLYWFIGSFIAFVQQWYVLRRDESEMEAMADAPGAKEVSNIPEGEVISEPSPALVSNKAKPSKSPKKKSKKRRKKR